MQQPSNTDPVRREDEEFGKRLAEVRKEAGLSQRGLATTLADLGLSIDPSAITRMERGERAVRLAEAKYMATALEVPLALLLGDETLPQDELHFARQDANQAMNRARSAIAVFLRRTLDAKRILEENPHLVRTLEGSEAIPTPESPNEYLSWVLTRLVDLGEDVQGSVEVDDDDLAAMVKIATELAVGVVRPGFPGWHKTSPEVPGIIDDPKEVAIKWLDSLKATLDGHSGLEFDRLRDVTTDLTRRIGAVPDSEEDSLHRLALTFAQISRAIRSGMPMHFVTRDLRSIRDEFAAGGIAEWVRSLARRRARDLVELTAMERRPEDAAVADALHKIAAEIRLHVSTWGEAKNGSVVDHVDEFMYTIDDDDALADMASGVARLARQLDFAIAIAE